jgi:hypothetical protein
MSEAIEKLTPIYENLQVALKDELGFSQLTSRPS